MKVTTEQIEKYIKKHPDAPREQIALHFGVSIETVRRRVNELGYVMRKVWVRV